MKRLFWKCHAGFTAIIFALCLCLPAAAAEPSAGRPVRVGYIDFSGFIEQDFNGYYQGYGVAYLNKIAQYTGWKYEYVYDTWDNCLDKLEKGEIDLVCNAQWTEERAKRFDYANEPIGSEHTIVYAREDNEDIYYQDYENMNGARVAVMEGAYQNRQFAEHAREKGIQYTEIHYPTNQEAELALLDGEVDLIVMGALAKHEWLKVVDQFGSAPFYIIAAKGNDKIMAPLNDALENINSISPYMEKELYEEYYGRGLAAKKPLLTREEAEYVRNMETLTVACASEFYPLSYKNESTGAADGIYPELTRKISELSGLKLKLIPVSPGVVPSRLIREGKADLVAGVLYCQELIQNPDMQLTDAVVSQPDLVVAQTGVNIYELEKVRLALPDMYANAMSVLPEYFRSADIIYKDTVNDCFAAVKSGEADATIQNTQVANYFMQMKEYSSLNLISMQALNEKWCILAPRTAPRELMSVLNKTISCVDTEIINQTTAKYTIAQPYQESFVDILKYYRRQILVLVILFATAVTAISVALHRHERIMIELREKEAYRIKAETDELTGMYNRKTFYEKADQLMQSDPEREFQILFFNLERFKVVNDLFGIAEGDKLLIFLSLVIKAWTEERGGVCSRFEADHFVVCVGAEENPQEILSRLQEKVKTYPLDMVIEVSCGVYRIHNKDKSINIMCDRAHLAVSSIKGNHARHLVVYDDTHRRELIHEQIVLNDMRMAFEEKQFQVYLQPKYHMDTDRIIGAEALVRWRHPERGLIPPSEFIPIFEHNGLIAQLDSYMVEETCRLIRGWMERGKTPVPVSVNLSRIEFYNPRLCENLCRLLNEYGISTELLELEITETAYAKNSDIIHGRLYELQNHGFKILMDDFGSGYSSLNMLKEAPINLIKLDMRFLSEDDPYGRAETILQMVIAMSNKMGIPVLAEGVENKKQAEMLLSYDCHIAQGYYYSRPLTEEDFAGLLEGSNEEPAVDEK